MKNIEKKIQENVNEILDCKLENGHRQRFEQKLAAQQKNKHVYNLTWLKYTAAAAAILIAALFVFKPQTSDNSNTALHDIHIIEVERYYAMQLDNEIRTTKKLLLNIDEQYRDEVLHDIKLMQSDKDNLPNALADEAKAAVIVSAYTRKIESMQNIQTNLIAYHKN